MGELQGFQATTKRVKEDEAGCINLMKPLAKRMDDDDAAVGTHSEI